MSEVERYLDVNPTMIWDRNSWDEKDSMVNRRFHNTDVWFTPMMNYVQMPKGVGRNQGYFTGREIVQPMHNHNAIGWYQHYIDSFYVDTREKRLQSRNRYGNKAQYDEYDEIVTRYSGDTDAFIRAVMQEQLLDSVKYVHEKLARDALLRDCIVRFMGDGSAFSLGTADFSSLNKTEQYLFQIKFVEEMSQRMSFRVEDSLHRWGTYAQPVPGTSFRGSLLVLVTSGVFFDLWTRESREWMIDLRQLTDERIINNNGGAIQYRNITIIDGGWANVLWNAGPYTDGIQAKVTSPIKWGDGAPDPDDLDARVDGVWITGQGSEGVTHYVQCDSVGTDKIFAGDIVTIHTSRTDAWGVTDGVDFTDGKTHALEVHSVDEANERLVFRKPITMAYDMALDEDPGAYAYITKGQHVHPVYAMGARGSHTWAGRTPVTWHTPTDTHRDYPSVVRVTWDERGEMNPWNLDLYEIVFCAASFGNRGAVSIT